MQDHINLPGKACCVGPNLCLIAVAQKGWKVHEELTISKQEEADQGRKPHTNTISFSPSGHFLLISQFRRTLDALAVIPFLAVSVLSKIYKY